MQLPACLFPQRHLAVQRSAGAHISAVLPGPHQSLPGSARLAGRADRVDEGAERGSHAVEQDRGSEDASRGPGRERGEEGQARE